MIFLLILLQNLTDAQKQIEKALEIAQDSPEALMAMNRMLFAMLIVVLIITNSVIVVLWRKNEKTQERDKERESVDNKFKTEFLLKMERSMDLQNRIGKDINDLTAEIRTAINNFFK